MNCKSSLKYILLFLLLVNTAIQTVEAYNYVRFEPKQLPNILSTSVALEKATDTHPISIVEKDKYAVSSNVLMVWKEPETNTIGYHNLDHASYEKLHALALALSPKKFDQLTTRAQHLSTQDFLALLDKPHLRKQILLAQIKTEK